MNNGIDDQGNDSSNKGEDLMEEYEDSVETNRFKKVITVLTVIIAAGGFVALSWFAYQSSNKLNSNKDLPVIKADNAPGKVAPEDPGGMVVPNMDKTVYDSLSGNKQAKEKERVLPAPEEPLDRKKLNQQEFPNVAEKQQEKKDAKEVAPVEKIAKAEKKQDVNKEEVPNYIKPFPDNEKSKFKTAAPVQKNKTKGYKVQLASFKSEKIAIHEWNKIKKKYNELLGNLEYFIEKKDFGSKGVFYRLQAGVVPSESDARLLCKKLIECKQGCFVVK
jgi:hypothetical protein